MYCCLECGCVFSEDEVSVWYEGRGEYCGVPCNEEMDGCPRCHGDYVQTYRCDECDEWIIGQYVKTSSGQRICDECYTVMELGDED